MEKLKKYFKNKDNLIAIGLIFYYFLIMEGASNLLSLLIKAFFSRDTIIKYNTTFSIIVNITIYILLGVLIIPLSLKYLKNDYEITSKNTYTVARSISIGILIMYIVSFASSVLSQILTSKSSANQDGINEMTSSTWGFISLFLVIGILGPIVEELIFRRALFQVFKNNTISIIISSLSFGLLHMSNQSGTVLDFFAILIPYVTAGIVFSSLYVICNKNILVPIACHITNNAVSLLIVAFSSGLIH